MTVKTLNTEFKPQTTAVINGKLGTLTTRLAENSADLHAAQRVRYEVFCEEFSAQKLADNQNQLEQEHHDLVCDHLLVLENETETIGTQRFLIKQAQDSHLQFRSQSEFDLEGLASRHPKKRFMELGRSCILKSHRSKRTMELMWHGTWAYAVENKIDVMAGCASFYASDVEQIKNELGFLSTLTSKSEEWKISPTSKNAIPIGEFENRDIQPKQAIRSLPPLIKGYLRLGAHFSDHAVMDEEFGTIDVAVILPVNNINPRYVSYYGADATKHR